MQVLFFKNFSKRKNSTKRPNDADGVLKDVVLKGQTDYVNPSFFLADVEGYVYCKAWGNYYFIHRVGYEIDGAQYVYCNIDVLATWKDIILNTKAFVKYSSSNYSDRIVDDRIARFTDVTYASNDYESIFENPEDTGTGENVFFITIGGEYSSSAYEGGYNYYQFSETGWNDFCAMMCDANLEQDIKKFFQSVDSALISCRRMPIKTSELPTGPVNAIRVGRTYVAYPANQLTERYIHKTIDAKIPQYKGNFEQWSPYTRLKLYIPFIGVVDLATDLFKDDDVIIDYVVDLVSGQMNVNICHHTTENIVYSYSTEIGGQLPTSVNNVNMAKVASHGTSAVGMLAQKNVVGAIAEAANAVSAGLTDNIGNKGTFGGGRMELLDTRFILYSLHWQPVFSLSNADYIEICGKPCYKVMQLTNLTGYVQTLGFSIDISALDVVKTMINDLMDSGVYLE